jgi:hypothetical protein
VYNRERAQSLHSFKGQRTREKRAYQYNFFSVASKFTTNHAKTLHSNERFAEKLNLEKGNPTLKFVLDLTFVCRASCIDCTSTKPHLSIPKTRTRITSGRGGKKNTSRRRRGRGGQARKRPQNVHQKTNLNCKLGEEKSREEEEDNDNDDDDDDNNDLVFFFWSTTEHTADITLSNCINTLTARSGEIVPLVTISSKASVRLVPMEDLR